MVSLYKPFAFSALVHSNPQGAFRDRCTYIIDFGYTLENIFRYFNRSQFLRFYTSFENRPDNKKPLSFFCSENGAHLLCRINRRKMVLLECGKTYPPTRYISIRLFCSDHLENKLCARILFRNAVPRKQLLLLNPLSTARRRVQVAGALVEILSSVGPSLHVLRVVFKNSHVCTSTLVKYLHPPTSATVTPVHERREDGDW